MPIYTYEPVDRDCEICEGKLELLQAISDEPEKHCPHCGQAIRRVISPVNFALSNPTDYDKAAQKGFTTLRRVEKGKYERIAGPEGD